MANRKDVFFIKPPVKEGAKAYWLKIGSAWENKDGSVNVKLDVPVIPGMDIQIRNPVEEKFGE